ncbi:MAG TPA: OsmC family peroxiredoxin [Fimbriimonas sp.]
MKRSASAVWDGSLKEGSGKFNVQSGVLKDVNYTFRTRFENEPGTNPEELVAAAHAACFSMAVSAELNKLGITPQSVRTTSNITFEEGTLKKSELDTTVVAPGADRAKVEQAANTAKVGCPIARALNLEITMNLNIE